MITLAGRGCLGYWTGAIGTSYQSDRAPDMTVTTVPSASGPVECRSTLGG